MEGSPFLPLPQGLLIDQVEQTATSLTVTVVSTRTEAVCPGCGHPSEHIHSQYQRTVRDVPSGGRQVVLRLCVRKFFCLSLSCPRKVFAERLPDLVQPWARCSDRLLEALKAIGLSASAEVSERLTPRLAMPVKASPLLCDLRTIPDPPRTNVISLGIDDFALKRGDTYGTILINAQTSKPLDLLADRTSEAVSPWLASHPEIQVVSRVGPTALRRLSARSCLTHFKWPTDIISSKTYETISSSSWTESAPVYLLSKIPL